MTPTIEKARMPALGCDTDTKLTLSSAQKLRSLGLTFVYRYLSLGDEAEADLTENELEAILLAGLRVGAVQHVRLPGWAASGSVGTTDGVHAGANAQLVGLPKGVTLFLDLEGTVSSAPEVTAYVNAWASEVRARGYEAGLYVGAGQPLTGDELYHALSVDRYWRSFSQVPEVTRRGYTLLQLYPTVTLASGLSVDVDALQEDYLGGTPTWAVAPGVASTLPSPSSPDPQG